MRSALDGPVAGDHDAAPGKLLVTGAKEDIAFTIRNTGSAALLDVAVADRTIVGTVALERLGCDFSRLGGPADGVRFAGRFYPGESFGCRGVLPGLPAGAQHADLASVTAVGRVTGTTVDDEDPWHGRTEREQPLVPTVIDPPRPALPPELLATGSETTQLLVVGLAALLAGISVLCFTAAARIRRNQRAQRELELELEPTEG